MIIEAISLMEPWASRILYEGKDTENRSWNGEHLGWVVICASKRPESGYDGIVRARLGCALGVVRIVGYDRDIKSSWDIDGQWHWRLADPRPFPEPIPQKGQLGFFVPCQRVQDAAQEEIERASK